MGLAKGKIVIHDDFDAVDAKIAKLFGMGECSGFCSIPMWCCGGFRAVTVSKIQSGRLPLADKDPFDRMLIAQAQAEGLIRVTHDEAILSSD